MNEMLKAIGKDWETDISLDNACRYGTFIYRIQSRKPHKLGVA